MNPSAQVVIVGMGELGSEFARGFLRLGYPVVPILRETPRQVALERVPRPELVLVTVGEDDLAPVLASLPPAWAARVGLVQNELLPEQWIRHGIADPTVGVVWFEKKPQKPVNVLLPSRLSGPNAPLLQSALSVLDIPATIVPNGELEFELICKNLYILLVNIAGLKVGGTVERLWLDHRDFTVRLGNEILSLEAALVGHSLDSLELFRRFEEAVFADPKHACTGRTARARLARALSNADRLNIEVPTLRAIHSDVEAADG